MMKKMEAISVETKTEMHKGDKTEEEKPREEDSTKLPTLMAMANSTRLRCSPITTSSRRPTKLNTTKVLISPRRTWPLFTQLKTRSLKVKVAT